MLCALVCEVPVNKSNSKYGWGIFAILAAIGGVICTSVAANYVVEYLNDADNPTRNEYLQGTILSLIFSFPFWLLLAVSISPFKASLPKSCFILLRMPAMLLGAAFMLMNAFLFVMIVVSKVQGG